MKDNASAELKKRFELPGSTASLHHIREIVTELARVAGLEEHEVAALECAVDEVCANIIEHGYSALSTKPPISVEIRRVNGDFVVDLVDYGPGFDFTRHVMPEFPRHYAEGNTRGAGLYLVRHLVDETEYTRQVNGTNRFRLIKHMH